MSRRARWAYAASRHCPSSPLPHPDNKASARSSLQMFDVRSSIVVALAFQRTLRYNTIRVNRDFFRTQLSVLAVVSTAYRDCLSRLRCRSIVFPPTTGRFSIFFFLFFVEKVVLENGGFFSPATDLYREEQTAASRKLARRRSFVL